MQDYPLFNSYFSIYSSFIRVITSEKNLARNYHSEFISTKINSLVYFFFWYAHNTIYHNLFMWVVLLYVVSRFEGHPVFIVKFMLCCFDSLLTAFWFITKSAYH